jgi:hypothetical protein
LRPFHRGTASIASTPLEKVSVTWAVLRSAAKAGARLPAAVLVPARKRETRPPVPVRMPAANGARWMARARGVTDVGRAPSHSEARSPARTCAALPENCPGGWSTPL